MSQVCKLGGCGKPAVTKAYRDHWRCLQCYHEGLIEEQHFKWNVDWFLANLMKLLETHRGQVVLIHRGAPVSFHPTIEAALNAGYEAYGMDHFIVQEVKEPEQERRWR